MADITTKELKELGKIGYGNFGTIYKYGDKAYKVYSTGVKTDFHGLVDNPVLAHPVLSKIKLNELIKRNSRIKNTDLIEDILYVDNSFRGVVLPYYDGELFLDLLYKPLEDKIKYSRMLVENAKELTDNYIYPLDYKLINVFLNDDLVKIIDLDDTFTKVCPFKIDHYENRSIIVLDETIKCFLRESYNKMYSDDVMKELNNKSYKANKTYNEINDYLDRRSKKKKLLFIRNVADLINHTFDDFEMIYVFDKFNNDQILSKIKEFKERGAIINDIIQEGKIKEYIDNNCTSECIYVDKELTLKIK